MSYIEPSKISMENSKPLFEAIVIISKNLFPYIYKDNTMHYKNFWGVSQLAVGGEPILVLKL